MIISLILMTLMCDSGVVCKEKLDACHSLGSKARLMPTFSSLNMVD